MTHRLCQRPAIGLVVGNLISGLVARRMALGLSQKRLAEMMGVRRSHIAGLERGYRSPTLPMLLLWTRELGQMVRIITMVGETTDKRRLRRDLRVVSDPMRDAA